MKLKITLKGVDLIYSFFAEAEQIPYQTPYKIIGQFSDETCVAACVQMILSDSGINVPQSYAASALDTKGGAYLSNVPQVLNDFGLKSVYEWKQNLSFTDLSAALKNGRAIVSLQRENAKFGHSVIADAIIGDKIQLRDPLPIGQGKSYAVRQQNFTNVWLKRGVIYVK